MFPQANSAISFRNIVWLVNLRNKNAGHVDEWCFIVPVGQLRLLFHALVHTGNRDSTAGEDALLSVKLNLVIIFNAYMWGQRAHLSGQDTEAMSLRGAGVVKGFISDGLFQCAIGQFTKQIEKNI